MEQECGGHKAVAVDSRTDEVDACKGFGQDDARIENVVERNRVVVALDLASEQIWA